MDVIITLLLVICGLLLLVLRMCVTIRRSLARLELSTQRPIVARESPVFEAMVEDGGARESAFDVFLAEDAARATMSKSEQAAAYRQWRREKGMNWSNS